MPLRAALDYAAVANARREPLRVFSFGGGVQSTAALVLAVQGKIDYRIFLFCNVGEDSENPDTLEYVYEHSGPWAQAHGIEFHELRKVLKRGPQRGEDDSVLGRMYRTKASIGIPVRMANTGAPGRRACTVDFKIRLVADWTKRHGATPERPATVGIGFSADEVDRIGNHTAIPWQTVDYPLAHLHLYRDQCEQIIRDAGLPVPPKSSCWFCPFHTRAEWHRMAVDHPERLAAAADLEQYIIERRHALGRDDVYLTDWGRPLREVFANGTQLGLDLTDRVTGHCEDGVCGR